MPRGFSLSSHKSACGASTAPRGADTTRPLGESRRRRLRVGVGAGEVVAYDFIYCGCSRAGGGGWGEPGCTPTGLGASGLARTPPAGCWSPRGPWPGLATPLL